MSLFVAENRRRSANYEYHIYQEGWKCFSHVFVDLAQGNVQNHHQCKPDGGADCSDVAVCTGLGFWNQLLDYNINHGARGKG